MDNDVDEDMELEVSRLKEGNVAPNDVQRGAQRGIVGSCSQDDVGSSALLPSTQISMAGASQRTPGRDHPSMPPQRTDKSYQRGKAGVFKKRHQGKQLEERGIRGSKFSGAELDYLLDSVQYVLPADLVGCNKVCEIQNEHWDYSSWMSRKNTYQYSSSKAKEQRNDRMRHHEEDTHKCDRTSAPCPTNIKRETLISCHCSWVFLSGIRT